MLFSTRVQNHPEEKAFADDGDGNLTCQRFEDDSSEVQGPDAHAK